VVTTRGAGITAAAGTRLTHHLFSKRFTLCKSIPLEKGMHSESLPHTFVHWESFAPAAPRRAWILVSESISELPLSRLVRIIGLSGRYPSNNLIRRSPILKRRSFGQGDIPVLLVYLVSASVSRDSPRLEGMLTTCY
jgi:hypothetical protein